MFLNNVEQVFSKIRVLNDVLCFSSLLRLSILVNYELSSAHNKWGHTFIELYLFSLALLSRHHDSELGVRLADFELAI